MWATAICLVYVATVCTLGVFSKAYRDNILQQWGLVLTSLACIFMVPHVLERDVLTPGCAMLLAGLVAFATGTLLKVVHFTRRRSHDGKKLHPR